MCVADGAQRLRGDVLSRNGFLGALAVAAAPFSSPGGDSETADLARFPLPPPPNGLTPGNALAARLAARSELVRATFARVAALADSIGDRSLRESVVGLITDPRPCFARAHPSEAARRAVRDALAAAGLVAADAPVDGIFPPGTHAESTVPVQPFWSTPGSSNGSHHAYPGGLAVHEYFNAATAERYARTYDRHYFGGRATVERDTVIAAALYHDISKTVVFGWHDDGSLFDELTIAGTGAHHILSGAEAIARGRPPRFVTTVLSAHAAPSLGDETKVAAWCRAAALIAGVDPVAAGLLTPAGALAANPVPLEAFINFLCDHDYVVSVHAMHAVGALLQARFLSNVGRPQPPAGAATFAWYRSAVLTRTTAIALYDTVARRGQAAFDAAVAVAESDLWPAPLNSSDAPPAGY